MQGRQYMQMLDEKLAASGKARHSASKYDFVKVRVTGRHPGGRILVIELPALSVKVIYQYYGI